MKLIKEKKTQNKKKKDYVNQLRFIQEESL